jgi:alkylation response protein AidB-like acyl-CoA dehydrogenase
VLLESSRSAAYYAAWAIDNDEADAHRSACLAKAYCSDAFSKVTSECIQIHGGFGFTWESDCHLYYKRAKAGALTFGDAAFNREEAVRELLD